MLRRAYRVASGTRVDPFPDPVRALFVSTRTIGDWQARAVRAVGLELVDVDALSDVPDEPALVFSDATFFTEMALRQLVAAGLRGDGDYVLTMPDTAATRALAPLSRAPRTAEGTRLSALVLAAGPRGRALDALVAAARPAIVEARERRIAARLPRADDRAVEVGITARVAADVTHWLHLLRLSQLAIGALLAEAARASPWRALRARWAGRRSPHQAARRLVFVDPSADVHPTADLEACIVGPGAVVRAHAHVSGSVLGAAVEVGDHAVVTGCALAERVQVLRASYFAHCAAFPRATLSSAKAQLSLFGRDTFLTSAALLLDTRLDDDIRVVHDGAIVSAGTRYLGACLGHQVQVGAHVAIAPGRAVPCGTVLVMPPEHVARSVAAGGGRQVIREGRGVPLEAPRVQTQASLGRSSDVAPPPEVGALSLDRDEG